MANWDWAQIAIIYLVIDVLAAAFFVGKKIEYTAGMLVLTIVTHGFLIWGLWGLTT